MNMSELDGLGDDEFRERFRLFLAEHYPPEWRQDDLRPFRRLRGEQARQWLRCLHEHGWRAPAWPREYGGMGLSFHRQLIYQQEIERAAVARIIDLGDTQLGPTLIQFGTPAQRQQYLPRIRDCSDIWCQGYSEPGAGSDLASLRTRARREGGHFVVDGQKIWTTHANESTHVFALVRTGHYERRQQGISFLLIDLASPGIRIRPIENLAGEDEFCEMFFDAVHVPAENLVGPLDEGWKVAKALLGYERIWIGSPALCGRALSLAHRLVQEMPGAGDAAVMDRLTQLDLDLHDYRLLYARVCEVAIRNGGPGPEASALKVYASELLQRITAFNNDVAAEFGGLFGEATIGGLRTDLFWQAAMALPPTIFAGANEIQRDLLAKSVLCLGTS